MQYQVASRLGFRWLRMWLVLVVAAMVKWQQRLESSYHPELAAVPAIEQAWLLTDEELRWSIA
jgi:hypothetical protein